MSGEQVCSIDGWTVRFRQNIHMYSHDLKLSRSGETYTVFCEDTPSGFVGIWPYELEIADAKLQELLIVLRRWAKQSGFEYRLYTSPIEYEANSSGA